MTTEQKAKAYDEALKMAKKELKVCGSLDCDAARQIFRFFPALKESEDEKIRKELIEFVKSRGGFKQEYIAWLEKQGENVPSRNMILSVWELGNEWKELTNGRVTEYGTQLEYIQKHWNESEYYLRDKQDKQKPTDKVEPKFKVGDWVVLYSSEIEANRKVVQISRVEICQLNMYWTTEGTWFGNGTDARLWTINDAKEGDVLVVPPVKGSEHSEQIFIFKEIKDREYVKNAVEYYCRCMDNKFAANECGFMGQSDDYFTPATKEQRDLLFQKMKEAGYEWDYNKKGLRKIEKQKPIEWNEEDEEMLQALVSGFGCYTYFSGIQSEDIVNWLKSLKQRFKEE